MAYYSYNRQFAQGLASLHISYHFDQQNGYHSWTLSQIFIYKALLWLHWYLAEMDRTFAIAKPSRLYQPGRGINSTGKAFF